MVEVKIIEDLHREYAGKAVSWMGHEAQRMVVHIHHQMCGQGG